MLPIKTVGAPGTQGAGVTGTQGIGVRTPRAAAVAAITAGFDGEGHMAKEGTLTMGAESITVAAGVPVRTRLTGRTESGPGAAPKLHCSRAPIHTSSAIEIAFLLWSRSARV